VERDRLSRELRSAEQSVSSVRGQLAQTRAQRAERAAERARLDTEKRGREAALARARAGLGAQLRAAYLLRDGGPLKLLLNQQDPAELGRLMTYYGYIGRERAVEIASINGNIARIAELYGKIESEDHQLAGLETTQKQQVGQLEQARSQRGKVLASLEKEARNHTEALARLQRQQAALEKLLKDLDRALEKFPVDAKGAFAKLVGQLAWPVEGKLTARFGETRAGGVKWNGVVIAAAHGAPVRAVYHGRVVYADWLPGLGQLLIIDHGGGFLSLYGHNDRLYKAAGAEVKAGDTVAAAGDSGGRAQDELYFEIRRGGKPVDPKPWFKNAAPPP
jgi:septal ring factor EnvC (AmiA/AmiB activator)